RRAWPVRHRDIQGRRSGPVAHRARGSKGPGVLVVPLALNPRGLDIGLVALIPARVRRRCMSVTVRMGELAAARTNLFGVVGHQDNDPGFVVGARATAS